MHGGYGMGGGWLGFLGGKFVVVVVRVVGFWWL